VPTAICSPDQRWGEF